MEAPPPPASSVDNHAPGTAGVGSLAALEQAGEENLHGKVLIDVANPLDFSGGFPPGSASATTTASPSRFSAVFRKRAS